MISDLQGTVRYAYENSFIYRQLYGPQAPGFNDIDGFRQLPMLTKALLGGVDGTTDIAVIAKQQLTMELNGLECRFENFPFTPVENEHDMERRYRRTTRFLGHFDANVDTTVILVEASSIYFAAEIERVLPWSIPIVLCGPNRQRVPELLDQLGSTTVISTFPPFDANDFKNSCSVMNFNRLTSVLPPYTCDVLTLKLLPWFAISRGHGVYDTLDGILGKDGDTDRQFYLESSTRDTLVVTALYQNGAFGAVPVIRYDTDIPVAMVSGHTFAVRNTKQLA